MSGEPQLKTDWKLLTHDRVHWNDEGSNIRLRLYKRCIAILTRRTIPALDHVKIVYEFRGVIVIFPGRHLPQTYLQVNTKAF